MKTLNQQIAAYLDEHGPEVVIKAIRDEARLKKECGEKGPWGGIQLDMQYALDNIERSKGLWDK